MYLILSTLDIVLYCHSVLYFRQSVMVKFWVLIILDTVVLRAGCTLRLRNPALIKGKMNSNPCHQLPFVDSECTKIVFFAAGALLRTQLEQLAALPRPPSVIYGATLVLGRAWRKGMRTDGWDWMGMGKSSRRARGGVEQVRKLSPPLFSNSWCNRAYLIMLDFVYNAWLSLSQTADTMILVCCLHHSVT